MTEAVEQLLAPELAALLCKGLAETYAVQPEQPLKFLGKWLLGAARGAPTRQTREENEARAALAHRVQQAEHERLRAAAEAGRHAQAELALKAQLRTEVEVAANVELLFLGDFCEKAKRVFGARNVYALQHGLPAQPQELTVVAADTANGALRGRVLPFTGSSLYDLLGQTDAGVLYVPDVIDPAAKVHFWDIPRLGAQLACLLEVPVYASAESFDDYAQRREEFLDERAQWDDESEPRVNEPPLAQTRRFVFVVDSLGAEEELPAPLREEVSSFCAFLRQKWAERNLHNLREDYERYAQLLRGLPPAEAEEGTAEARSKAEGVQWLADLRQQLSGASEDLLGLRCLGFVKFDEVVQLALLCVLRSREACLNALTGGFDWLKGRELFTSELLERFAQLDVDSPMAGAVPGYASTPTLLERAEAVDAVQLKQFFSPLATLLACVHAFLAQRLASVQRQRREAAVASALRAERLQAQDDQAARLQEELKEARRAFEMTFEEAEEAEEAEAAEEAEEGTEPPGETPARTEFDEQGWVAQWRESNPPVEIPGAFELPSAADVPSDYEFDAAED